MICKLTTYKDGLALVIDKAMLDRLEIDENTLLKVTIQSANEVTAYRKCLVVAPLVEEEHERLVSEALLKVNSRHSKTFKKLAE